jgi:hypothetical protein
MRRTLVLAVAATAAAGLVGIARHRRERARVRAGLEPPLSNDAVRPPPRGEGALSRRLATWVPGRPRTPTGRVLAAAWAAPATSLGLVAAVSTGGRWWWDDAVGAVIVAGGEHGMNVLQARLGFAANTLGHVIICRQQDPSAALLAHEAVHVRQTERFGALLLPVYLWLMARWGYRDHPIERAARLGAARVSAPPRPQEPPQPSR